MFERCSSNICDWSQCLVYWLNFQNIYTFTYQKTLLHTFLLLVFKIVESLQCILNLFGNRSVLVWLSKLFWFCFTYSFWAFCYHSSMMYVRKKPCAKIWPQKSHETRIAGDWNLIQYIRCVDLIITLSWDVVNHKFSSRVFEVKWIHPYSWIHVLLINQLLPVQTYRNSFRPNFCNFSGTR